MSVSSWDIKFFTMPVFRESEAVSVSQIPETFELKNVWEDTATIPVLLFFVVLN